MTLPWGPNTDTYGWLLTSTPDGSGGIILSCAKFGSLDVSAANWADPLVAELVARIERAEDFVTNWDNLVTRLAAL